MAATPVLAFVLIGSASAQTPALHPVANNYEVASIAVPPGSICILESKTGNADTGQPQLVADLDGFLRFLAVRAGADSPFQKLTFQCTDRDGKRTTYVADLRSDATFESRPLPVSRLPGHDRPALPGDPMKPSLSELLRSGYGLRPDPRLSPDLYARWLKAAQRPMRMLEGTVAPVPGPKAGIVSTKIGPKWTGGVLKGSRTLPGAPSYTAVTASVNIPYVSIEPYGNPARTNTAIWVGLDGEGGAPLIQTGAFVGNSDITPTYGSFSEYIGGQLGHPSNRLPFNPSPGDEVLITAWYCDANGYVSTTQHYGCTTFTDVQQGITINCMPTGTTCPAIPPLPVSSTYNPTYGKSAEFIVELVGGSQWTDYSGTVTMMGMALLSNGRHEVISTDPHVNKLVDWTQAPTHIVVTLGTTDQVYWNVKQRRGASTGPGPVCNPGYQWCPRLSSNDGAYECLPANLCKLQSNKPPPR